MKTDDLSMVLDWRNDPNIYHFMYSQNLILFEDHKRWFKRASDNDDIHLRIFEVNSQPSGFIKFNKIAL